MREQALVNLYMQLAGSSESRARSVYMHVLAPDGEPEASRDGVVLHDFNGEKNSSTEVTE